jgi:hypothetical protein
MLKGEALGHVQHCSLRARRRCLAARISASRDTHAAFNDRLLRIRDIACYSGHTPDTPMLLQPATAASAASFITMALVRWQLTATLHLTRPRTWCE